MSDAGDAPARTSRRLAQGFSVAFRSGSRYGDCAHARARDHRKNRFGAASISHNGYESSAVFPSATRSLAGYSIRRKLDSNLQHTDYSMSEAKAPTIGDALIPIVSLVIMLGLSVYLFGPTRPRARTKSC